MKKIAPEKLSDDQITDLLSSSLQDIKNKTTMYLKTIDPDASSEEAIVFLRNNRATRDNNEIIGAFNIERLTTSNLQTRMETTINLLLYYLINAEDALAARSNQIAWNSQLKAVEYLGYLECLNDPIITKRASRSENGGHAKATKQKNLKKAIQQHIANIPQNKKKTNDQIAREITDTMYKNEAESKFFGTKSRDDIISLVFNTLIEHRKKKSTQ